MAGLEGQTVAKRDEIPSAIFEAFERRRKFWIWLTISAYIFINNTINATSSWMEHSRGGIPDIGLWEPFTWEYSSALSTLLLLPILFYWFGRFAFRWYDWKRQILVHLAMATLFALFHVVIMVSMREAVYIFAGGNYDFGDPLREFIYELRKDVWGYGFWFLAFHSYQFIYRRLRGEASLIEEEREPQTASVPQLDHILVKKLDKEYLVKLQDVDWLESAGNYVNLHSQGRVYPLRGTMKHFTETVASQGFKRVHRSYAVNVDAIAHIAYQASGDGEITMTNGSTLPLSRRYKEDFKQYFYAATNQQ